MKVIFWGVRGSLPAPETSSRIRGKIAAIMERLQPEDLSSLESRNQFLEALPPQLSGTAGGNTACVGLYPGDAQKVEGEIIFDAGSGIRELGMAAIQKTPKPSRYHIFFSHFHWDHLQGFPFFVPAYDPAVGVDFYSPLPDIETVLRGQMSHPYFPVELEAMACKKNFHHLKGPVSLQGLTISSKRMSHPGDSYSYLADNGKCRFLYATDAELSAADFVKNKENSRFFKNLDLAVLDAQYTLGEAVNKNNWGHNAFSMAVDFAANWGIKRLALFHHDPAYDDEKIFDNLKAAREYMQTIKTSGTEIILAVEGMEIVL